MKCEKCNEREANFFYTSNINGKITNMHLCSECAAEEGLLNNDELFGGFFKDPFEMRDPFGMFEDFWNGNFFAPFGRTLLATPTLERPEVERLEETEEDKIPADAGAEFKAKRELKALKAQLKKAVAAEDFEKAIKLRDEIRSREQK
ncbi:MAG: UvrB/UvrC motif-containing protein [Oscillospiraceae bacterium]